MALDEGELVLMRRYAAWVSSHQLGTEAEAYAVIALSSLPADAAAAERIVRPLLEVGEIWNRPTPPRRCRFCGVWCADLDYLAEEQCCHACAHEHLGVIF